MDSYYVNKLLKYLLHWLLAIMLSGSACHAYSAPEDQANIAVLLSGNAPYYQQASRHLHSTLANQLEESPKLEVFQFGSVGSDKIDSGNYQLVVTVGTKASQYAATMLRNTPVLAIFIPKSSFERIVSELPENSTRKYSAIFLDQPLHRLVNLGLLLQPQASQIGTVLGPISHQHLETLQQLAKNHPFNLHYRFLGNDDNPVSTLKPVVMASDIFVAVPDQAILNRSVAKWILYLSYSEKIPVIGFSKAYTDAGALASVFSTPENIGHHTGELIGNWLSNQDNTIWQPQYPAYCTVKTNHAVARSLGITLPDKEILRRQLEAMERKQR